MPAGLSAVESLAARLQEFGESLPPDQQEALRDMIVVFADVAEEAFVGADVLALDDAAQDAVRAALEGRSYDDQFAPLTTPCWTVTTVTTTTTTVQTSRVACHPPPRPPRPPRPRP